MKKSQRYHHLDALRAIMMILGIVIHSALTYGTKDHSLYWGVTDTLSTHITFDALADLIHLFRMQIFFVIAGFFAAMLYFERSPKAMLQNRVNRILFPFLAAIVILIPLNSIAFVYSQQIVSEFIGTFIHQHTFMSMTLGENVSLMHLWFLYYLMFFCLLAWFITNLMLKYYKPQVVEIRKRFEKLFLSGRIFWIGISLTWSALLLSNSTFTTTSLSFIPNPITFYTYLVFFGFGWYLYHSKKHLNWFGQYYKRYLYTGFGLCLVRWSMPVFVESHEVPPVFYIKMTLAPIIMWLLVYGIIGFFIEKFAKYSARMRYISDASYWIYLIHLPLTAFLPSCLIGVKLLSGIKFLIVVTITTMVTISTYHYFVRSTFIGQFLNGRKYSKSKFTDVF